MINRRHLTLALLTVVGCAEKKAALKTDASQPAPAAAYFSLNRLEFNRRAQEHFEPYFWRSDDNQNGAIDASELAVLVGPWNVQAEAGFPKNFDNVYRQLTKPIDDSALPAAERARREALRRELRQSQPTLIETNLTDLSLAERKAYEHFARVAQLIEHIYARQHDTLGIAERIPENDRLSRAVFHRNQSPFCAASKTKNDHACQALASPPPRTVGLYPREIQSDPNFCSRLAQEPNKDQLMDHFSIVVADGKRFKTIPYSEAYREQMEAVAVELEKAEALFDASEATLKLYLTAAAKAFRTNDWEGANRAWVEMGATNSKWYLRVGPDETYHEPCSWKAGFAMQLARINPASLTWQEKLAPLKGEMENTLAALAGTQYQPHGVKFKLPDFINVVLNAGDQRNSEGGTIGQSLPNWGRTAETGGRTVVMTNLNTDADSLAAKATQVSSLLCKESHSKFSNNPQEDLVSILLHEVAHNLGPAHDYRVKGKTDDEIFGGPLASTMEELKAQTSALFFAGWLLDRGLLTSDEVAHSVTGNLAWMFRHIASGMYDARGGSKAYSQLAAIQLGSLLASKAVTWKATEMAANGSDTGCFEVDLASWRTSVNALEALVIKLKGTGNKKGAEELKARFVDAQDEWARLRNIIAERNSRTPSSTYVYSVKR
jgi:hypothetical protein